MGCGLVVFSCFVASDAWRVRSELQAGSAQLETVRHGQFRGVGAVRARTATAVRHVRRADDLVHHSRWLGALSSLPIADRQVATARRIADAAAQAGVVAEDAVNAMDTSTRRPLRTGADRLRLLQDAEQILRIADARLAHIRVQQPRGFVLPPLPGAATRLRGQIAGAELAIGRSRATVASVIAMFQGPRTYLVLAANNAEMRGAGGMPLQVGTVSFNEGDISAGPFRPASDLVLPSPVPIPPEMDALYGWLEPGREWRNTGSSANFPEVAPVYRAMATAAGLGQVDGVVQLDVVALANILRAVGPVDVDSVRVDASNVGRLVLHDAYAWYGPSKMAERHEALGQLASATVQAMRDRPWQPGDMIAALASAARGRHVTLWSNTPDEAATWQRLGADGSLRPDGILVAIQNQTGNKLDYFLKPSASLSASRSDRRSRLSMRVRVRNAVPAGEVDYVAGNSQHLPFGTYRALVTVYLPRNAFDARVFGGSVAVVGDDGPMRVLGVRLDIGPGAARDVRVEFSLPPAARHLVLLPSARAFPTTVRWRGETLSDARARTLAW